MQTFLKLASNPKMSVSKSQFPRSLYYFQNVNTSQRKNDYDCAAICWVYRTLTEVPDSRDRTAVPLVLQTRISKAFNDLIAQCNYS
jgi:hypothetical protein